MTGCNSSEVPSDTLSQATRYVLRISDTINRPQVSGPAASCGPSNNLLATAAYHAEYFILRIPYSVWNSVLQKSRTDRESQCYQPNKMLGHGAKYSVCSFDWRGCCFRWGGGRDGPPGRRQWLDASIATPLMQGKVVRACVICPLAATVLKKPEHYI